MQGVFVIVALRSDKKMNDTVGKTLPKSNKVEDPDSKGLGCNVGDV